MKLILKNGASIEVDNVHEYLSSDKTYTIFAANAKNPGADLNGLLKIFNVPGNLESIKTVTASGTEEVYTGYEAIIDISRRVSDFDSGFDIRLAPPGKTQI